MDGYYNVGCKCTSPSGYHTKCTLVLTLCLSDTIVHQLSSAARRIQTSMKIQLNQMNMMIYLAVVQKQNSHLPYSTSLFLAMSTWFLKYCVYPCPQTELPLF